MKFFAKSLLLLVMFLLCLGLCNGQSHGMVLRDVPGTIDTKALYLFYLHGYIVEAGNTRPTSPKFGVYEYEQILETFKRGGFVVISEARQRSSEIKPHAEKVAVQVKQLLNAGVPPQNITVVGASQGAWMAMLVSTYLKNRSLNFVALGACAADDGLLNQVDLYGNVLFISEKTDLPGSCQRFRDDATGLSEYKEVETNTGQRHGFLYRPMKEWVAPTSAWAQTHSKATDSISSQRKLIAVTFDDLPAAGRSRNYSSDAIKGMTSKLLQTFVAHRIPVVGFVNERGLYQKTGEVDERIAVLQMWLDAGHELGNHTFSHLSLTSTPLEIYKEDVIRGETVTKLLLEKKGKKLRYFRYPFFFTGPTPEAKNAFESFLAQRGYINAPATIDNQDYVFADVYAKAKERAESETMKRVVEDYVAYMETMMEFYEKLSSDLFGRVIPQVFYVHANPLNCDHFEEVAQMLEKRGYTFVQLEQVLQDKAYTHPDNYAGPMGISWLQRWAMTEGKKFRTEPDVSPFVKQLFETK